MKKLFAIALIVMLAVSLLSVSAAASGSTNVSAVIEIVEGADNNRVALDGSFTANISLKNPSGEHISSYKVEIAAEGYTMSLVDENTEVGNLSVLNNLPNFSAYGVRDSDTLNTDAYLAKVKFTPTALGKKSITVTLANIAVNFVPVPVSGVSNSIDVTVYHTNHTWNTFDVAGATPDSEGYVTTVEPTCQDGEAKRQCMVDGCEFNTVETKTLPGDSSKHVLGDYQKDETGHWKVCSVCGETVGKEDHTGEIKDNEDGKTHSLTCEVCGYASAAENHSSSAAPKSDSTSHWYICDACGAEFGKDAHTVDEQTWKSDDSYHWHECSVCEYKVGQEAHTPGKDANITKYPTCTEPGEGTYECTKCGKAISGTIAPLEHKWDDGVIKEGDEPTYRKEGTKTFTCQNKIGADETPCGETKTEAVAKLQLASNTVTFAAGTNPDYVNNMTAMQEPVEDAVKQAVADMLENEEPTGISAELKKAIADVLDSKEDGKSLDIVLKADVAVVADETAVPAALKESIDTYFSAEKVKTYSFAAGLSFDLTATVNGTAVGAPVTQLPVGAQFNLTVPVAPPIHCLFGQAGGTVGGMGQFSGTFSDVNPSGTYVVYSSSDLSLAAVQYTVESTYTGSAVEPAVELVINSGETVDPKYYNVEYKDNTNVTDKAQIIITLTDEGKAAGFTLEEAMTFTFSITPAPATATPKPTGSGSTTNNNGNAPDTGDETNVALYAVVLAVCTAALVLVVTLRKKSSR